MMGAPKVPLTRIEKRAAFALACVHLEPVEVIALYLRLDGYTLDEIGERLHVSHTTAVRIIGDAVDCLQGYL